MISGLLFLCIWSFTGCEKEKTVSRVQMQEYFSDKEYTQEDKTSDEPELEDMDKLKVILDPGHGGFDPGKVSVTGTLEKDLNLVIAKKVKEYLETYEIEVLMTRTGDYDLAGNRKNGRKTADMKARTKLIADEKPVCTVSIHQNSYTDASVCGPQVFYYHTSEEGATLAEHIQTSMNENLVIEHPREQKENDTYYILKRSSSVTVLVECGFISNPAEAELLETEAYQKKIAAAIGEGILNYLEIFR